MIADFLRDASTPLTELMEALGPDRWRFARFQFTGHSVTVHPGEGDALNEDVRALAINTFLAHGWGLGTTFTWDLQRVAAIHLRHPSTLSRAN